MEARITNFVLATINQSRRRWTPQVLRNKIAARFNLTRRQAGTIIGGLVAAGELTYTYHLGHSFLEISFNRPVRVSNRVVLKPPTRSYTAQPEDVVIDIQPGAAFGVGAHPTTQLAIQGVEYALQATDDCRTGPNTSVLDIGTGSGVLAITALKMGIASGMGTDIDPCARVEALENIRLNGLADRVTISDRSIEEMTGRFTLIVANLRYPTLVQLLADLAQMMGANGVAVLSGFKTDETQHLLACCFENRLESIWQAEDRQWAAMIIKIKEPAE